MEELILENIKKEIEQKHNCKVISISYAKLLSLCVMFKVKFNDDFLYKPFKCNGLPNPDTICFSEKSANFTKRVDLFECVQKMSKLN